MAVDACLLPITRVTDPHDAIRGFWFAHIGWLYLKKDPRVAEAGVDYGARRGHCCAQRPSLCRVVGAARTCRGVQRGVQRLVAGGRTSRSTFAEHAFRYAPYTSAFLRWCLVARPSSARWWTGGVVVLFARLVVSHPLQRRL